MHTTDLIDAISDKTGLSVPQAKKALHAALTAIAEAVSKGEKVTITGFASFENKPTPARTALDPRTKEPITVPARRRVSISAGSELKKAAQRVAVTA